MGSNNIGVKIILAIIIILGLLFAWWKLGLFDIIGGCDPSPDGKYYIVSIEEMFKDLENNSLAAKDKYEGRYVSITGELSKIDSSYVVVSQIDELAIFNRVFCRIKSNKQKDKIKKMNKGDIVTVKGKITEIGKIKGCYLNMVEIF